MTEKSFNLVRDGDSDSMSSYWEADVKAYADAQTLKKLFFTEDWVFIVVDLVALKIANQEIRVMRRYQRDGEWVYETAPNHPLNRIVERPNQFQDYFSWMYWLVVDLTITGNSINWVQSISNKIIPLPAENMSIDFNSDGAIRAYVSREYYGDGELYTHSNVTSFRPEQIIHIKRPNPSSLLWGMSPFIPGNKSVLFNRYSSEYLNNFYIKGATPGFALEMGEEANEKVAMRLLRSFEMAYTGRRNQRRTLVLPKGVSLKPVTTTIGDQQLTSLVDKNRETIIALLKVPKHELGLQGTGSLGSNEYNTALKNFWAATLLPTQKMIAGALNLYYKNLLGEDHYFEFDNSDVDVLQENKDTTAALAEKMLKTHTLNEVRATIYNLQPIEGGDVVTGYNTSLISNSTINHINPTSSLIDKPKQESLQSQTLNGAQVDALIRIVTQVILGQIPRESALAIIQAAFNMSEENANYILGDAGQGFKPETVAPGVIADTTTQQEIINKPAKSKFKTTRVKSIMAESSRKIDETLKQNISAIQSITLETFSDMAVAMIKAVKNELKKSYKELDSKAELKRKIRKALETYDDQWVNGVKNILKTNVEQGYDLAVNVPWNAVDQQQIDALRSRNAKKRLDILETRLFDTFDNMNKNTTEDVINMLGDMSEENASIDDMTKAIQDKFSEFDKIGYRADRIARTETLTALSIGQAAAMKDAATVVPNLKKIWLTMDDDRVRDEHKSLDGDVVDWDKPFDNGLSFPRDPSGDAGSVINCRCTWVTLPAEQMSEYENEVS